MGLSSFAHHWRIWIYNFPGLCIYWLWDCTLCDGVAVLDFAGRNRSTTWGAFIRRWWEAKRNIGCRYKADKRTECVYWYSYRQHTKN
jgi:hypothetical protein